MPLGYDNVFCRRRIYARRIDTDYVAWEAEKAFADGAGRVKRGDEDEEVTAAEGRWEEDMGDAVIEDYFSGFGHCGKHGGTSDLRDLRLGDFLEGEECDGVRSGDTRHVQRRGVRRMQPIVGVHSGYYKQSSKAF